MPRERILGRVRAALGRTTGQPAATAPPPRIVVPKVEMEERIACMRANIEALAGKTARAAGPDAACALVAGAIAGKSAVASNAPYLVECGITGLPGVRCGIADRDELRRACAAADVGITSADYALADTGTLVTIASPQEARMVSLLPPAHIAVVPKDRILTGLDELVTILPEPATQTSSMVLITGPSRTGDIELILVRGVHGPGQITVVVVG
jgi:L-lactate dehydrogenase complex protein LldG